MLKYNYFRPEQRPS